MRRRGETEFEDDDEPDDGDDAPSGLRASEAPDDSDLGPDGDGDDDETIPCPYCRRPVYEQAEICPHCNRFISSEDVPRRLPWWVWAGVVLCLVAVLLWAL